MFQAVLGCLSTRRMRTTDLMLLKPYFQGTTRRIGAPFWFSSVLPYRPDGQDRQRVHRLVHPQTFHVGPLEDLDAV